MERLQQGFVEGQQFRRETIAGIDQILSRKLEVSLMRVGGRRGVLQRDGGPHEKATRIANDALKRLEARWKDIAKQHNTIQQVVDDINKHIENIHQGLQQHRGCQSVGNTTFWYRAVKHIASNARSLALGAKRVCSRLLSSIAPRAR